MNEEILNEIKQLCIVNFLELQEIRKRLNISPESKQEIYDYQNSTEDYMKDLDSKVRSLIQIYPHLMGKKQ